MGFFDADKLTIRSGIYYPWSYLGISGERLSRIRRKMKVGQRFRNTIEKII